MNETDQMQGEYATRIRRCLESMDKDRRIPSSGMIASQIALIGLNIFSLLSIVREGQFPPAFVWCLFGFQVSIVSMWVAEWVHTRWSAKFGSMAMAMLPDFESQQYKTNEDMTKDLNEICRHVERSTDYLMIGYHYVDGWRRTAAMVGGVASIFLLLAAAFSPDNYLLSVSSSLIFGFFAFKALYVIMRDNLWIGATRP
jgi:hypothetical protein